MQRGIITEVQSRHWIVLTPDGEFMKVPKLNSYAQVGEEVRFQTGKRTNRQPWIMAASVAVAAMLGMLFLFPQLFTSSVKAETHVYLDVNPSIAIEVDGDKRVIGVRPLNQSAKKLLQQLEWENDPVDEFVVKFLAQTKSNGYMNEEDQVVLSGIKEEKNSQATMKKLQETIEQKVKTEVKALMMPKKVQVKAEKTGLSPLKYTALVLANKQGQKLSVKELEEKPFSELAEEVEPVSELLTQPLTESEWEEIAEADIPETKEESQPAEADTDASKDGDGTDKPAIPSDDQAPPSQQKEDPAKSEDPASTPAETHPDPPDKEENQGSNTQQETGTNSSDTGNQ